MSDTITMRHPTLPAHQEIEVPKDAMPHYTAAGWQLVPQKELDERAARKAQADAEAAEVEGAPAADPADEPEQSEPAEAPTDRPARLRAKAQEKKGE